MFENIFSDLQESVKTGLGKIAEAKANEVVARIDRTANMRGDNIAGATVVPVGESLVRAEATQNGSGTGSVVLMIGAVIAAAVVLRSLR